MDIRIPTGNPWTLEYFDAIIDELRTRPARFCMTCVRVTVHEGSLCKDCGDGRYLTFLDDSRPTWGYM